MNRRCPAAVALVAVLAHGSARLAASTPVRVLETAGGVHGFLVLRDATGETLADGELIQAIRRSGVESRLTFRFRDGSLQEERVVYTQKRVFRLLSYRLTQRGPSFPATIEAAVDAGSGEVRVESRKAGEERVVHRERLDLPDDLAQGPLLLVLLKNLVGRGADLSMVAFAPKPRLVTLHVVPDGEEPFALGATPRTASRHRVKVDLGGVAGAIAPLVGKQPPDSRVWILGGEAPAFLRADQPFFADGPVWRVELTTPDWPAPGAVRAPSAAMTAARASRNGRGSGTP